MYQQRGDATDGIATMGARRRSAPEQKTTLAVKIDPRKKKTKHAPLTAQSTQSTTQDTKRKLFEKTKRSEPNALLSKRERKERHRQLKAKKNKNYGVIMEITTLWEKLRPKDVSQKQRRKLMDLAMSRIKGRIPEIVRNPKASRVLQSCLQHGSDDDRQTIMKEIHREMPTLSMSKYGKHLVQRIINKTPREEFETVFRVFPANCSRLLKHQYGSDVLNDLFCKCSDLQKHELIIVCYGKELHATLSDNWQQEYLLQKNAGGDPSSLETVFKGLDPVQRAGLLQKLHSLLNVVIEKGLLVNQLSHRLILEFFYVAPAAHVEDLAITMAETGDGLLKMVHTKEGSAVAAAVLRYTDANRRKMTLRAFKDYVKETAIDEWGYIVLIMAFRVVDDTKMLQKTLMNGIVANLEDICTSRYGRCILLDILNPNCSRYLPKKIERHLNPRPLKIITEQTGEVRFVGVSKKDPLQRRTELMSSGSGSLVNALLDLCRSKAAFLLKSRRGCDIVIEVARGGGHGLLDIESVRKVHSSIISAFMEDDTLFTDRPSKGVILRLLYCSKTDTHSHAKIFCKALRQRMAERQPMHTTAQNSLLVLLQSDDTLG